MPGSPPSPDRRRPGGAAAVPAGGGLGAALAVIPAAGRSRRMGRPKPLLPFGDTTVLGAVAAALAGGGAREVVVVAAPDDRALARHATRLGLACAVNPDPSRGMLSSVLAGIEALGGAAALARRGEPLLVCPADLPALAPATVRAVLDALAAGAALALPVHRGRRGHPLGIAPRLAAEIATLDLAAGLRQLLDRHPGELAEIPVDDPGAVDDVDTPDDYRRLRGRRVP